jgi:hypothetical protein
MNVSDRSAAALWIYTQAGAFRFGSTSRWEGLFARVVHSGWKMSSEGNIGWLHSELNPYPAGSFFTAELAESFAEALRNCVHSGADEFSAIALSKLAGLFSLGPVLVRTQPPRNTAFTDGMEVAYGYSCSMCGFIYHGSWLFSTAELGLEEIRSTAESMLKRTYCPLCGSEEVVFVSLFLLPFDPDRASDFMAWEDPPDTDSLLHA